MRAASELSPLDFESFTTASTESLHVDHSRVVYECEVSRAVNSAPLVDFLANPVGSMFLA